MNSYIPPPAHPPVPPPPPYVEPEPTMGGGLLRDWLAGMVAAGIVETCKPMQYGLTTEECQSVAESSYMLADALLGEREKGGAK